MLNLLSGELMAEIFRGCMFTGRLVCKDVRDKLYCAGTESSPVFLRPIVHSTPHCWSREMAFLKRFNVVKLLIPFDANSSDAISLTRIAGEFLIDTVQEVTKIDIEKAARDGDKSIHSLIDSLLSSNTPFPADHILEILVSLVHDLFGRFGRDMQNKSVFAPSFTLFSVRVINRCSTSTLLGLALKSLRSISKFVAAHQTVLDEIRRVVLPILASKLLLGVWSERYIGALTVCNLADVSGPELLHSASAILVDRVTLGTTSEQNTASADICDLIQYGGLNANKALVSAGAIAAMVSLARTWKLRQNEITILNLCRFISGLDYESEVWAAIISQGVIEILVDAARSRTPKMLSVVGPALIALAPSAKAAFNEEILAQPQAGAAAQTLVEIVCCGADFSYLDYQDAAAAVRNYLAWCKDSYSLSSAIQALIEVGRAGSDLQRVSVLNMFAELGRMEHEIAVALHSAGVISVVVELARSGSVQQTEGAILTLCHLASSSPRSASDILHPAMVSEGAVGILADAVRAGTTEHLSAVGSALIDMVDSRCVVAPVLRAAGAAEALVRVLLSAEVDYDHEYTGRALWYILIEDAEGLSATIRELVQADVQADGDGVMQALAGLAKMDEVAAEALRSAGAIEAAVALLRREPNTEAVRFLCRMSEHCYEVDGMAGALLSAGTVDILSGQIQLEEYTSEDVAGAFLNLAQLGGQAAKAALRAEGVLGSLVELAGRGLRSDCKDRAMATLWLVVDGSEAVAAALQSAGAAAWLIQQLRLADIHDQLRALEAVLVPAAAGGESAREMRLALAGTAVMEALVHLVGHGSGEIGAGYAVPVRATAARVVRDLTADTGMDSALLRAGAAEALVFLIRDSAPQGLHTVELTGVARNTYNERIRREEAEAAAGALYNLTLGEQQMLTALQEAGVIESLAFQVEFDIELLDKYVGQALANLARNGNEAVRSALRTQDALSGLVVLASRRDLTKCRHLAMTALWSVADGGEAAMSALRSAGAMEWFVSEALSGPDRRVWGALIALDDAISAGGCVAEDLAKAGGIEALVRLLRPSATPEDPVVKSDAQSSAKSPAEQAIRDGEGSSMVFCPAREVKVCTVQILWHLSMERGIHLALLRAGAIDALVGLLHDRVIGLGVPCTVEEEEEKDLAALGAAGAINLLLSIGGERMRTAVLAAGAHAPLRALAEQGTACPYQKYAVKAVQILAGAAAKADAEAPAAAMTTAAGAV